MKNHGGKRQGAGKPAQYDKPMRAVEVTLDEETIEFYKSVGNGNLSKGIREHWRGLTKPAPDAGDSAASSELVHASAESTSQTESAPTQRG